jgi:hypothetical protein
MIKTILGGRGAAADSGQAGKPNCAKTANITAVNETAA